MALIVLEPSAVELGLFGDEYDELVVALEAKGHEVQVSEPLERRSAGGDALEVADLVVRVAQFAGQALETAEVIAWVRRRLRARLPGRAARGVIYLPGDQVHKFEYRLDD